LLGPQNSINNAANQPYSDAQSYSLIRWRKGLQDKGYSHYAKQLTVALESGTLSEALNSDSYLEIMGGVMRFIILGFTTSYGLYLSRALFLLLGVSILFSLFYWRVIAAGRRSTTGGIYRVLADDRIVPGKGGYKLLKKKAQRVTLRWNKAYPYALLFSAVSAFQLGWKDINIGAWISRLQRREFSLVSVGWVRTVAGIQTLISLGLLVIWVLALFCALVE
jgi:hypothetical protein